MAQYVDAPPIGEEASLVQGPAISTLDALREYGTPFPNIIDNSMRAAYVKCAISFWRAYIQNLALRGSNVHLHAGAVFAKSLEVARKSFWDDGLPPQQAEAIGLRALYDAYGSVVFEPTRTGDKSVENLVRAYESYWLEYPIALDHIKPMKMANGKHAIEFSFGCATEVRHPVTNDPLIYAGRFDQLGHYNNTLFIEDEKTTTALGDQWKNNWKLDSQFTGYCWGARSYGYPVGGAIIRGVGLLKTKISHQEVIEYRAPWFIDRWYEQLNYDLEDMVRDWKASRYRYALDKSACAAYGGCAFVPLCESPQPEKWIEPIYEHRVWNPLDRH